MAHRMVHLHAATGAIWPGCSLADMKGSFEVRGEGQSIKPGFVTLELLKSTPDRARKRCSECSQKRI